MTAGRVAGRQRPCYGSGMISAAAHLWLITRALARPGGV
jgi:hypothetical protein